MTKKDCNWQGDAHNYFFMVKYWNLITIRTCLFKFVKFFVGSLAELEKLEAETVKGLFGKASTFNIHKNSVKTLGEVAEITRPGGAHLMKKGALQINGVKICDPDQKLDVEQFLLQNKFSLICWGKRKFSLIQWL